MLCIHCCRHCCRRRCCCCHHFRCCSYSGRCGPLTLACNNSLKSIPRFARSHRRAGHPNCSGDSIPKPSRFHRGSGHPNESTTVSRSQRGPPLSGSCNALRTALATMSCRLGQDFEQAPAARVLVLPTPPRVLLGKPHTPQDRRSATGVWPPEAFRALSE